MTNSVISSSAVRYYEIVALIAILAGSTGLPAGPVPGIRVPTALQAHTGERSPTLQDANAAKLGESNLLA